MGIGSKDECKIYDRLRKEYIQVQRPEVIKLYNESMGGVDKMDFLLTLDKIQEMDIENDDTCY